MLLVRLRFENAGKALDFVTLAEMDRKQADIDDLDPCLVVADFKLLRMARQCGATVE